MLIKTLRQPAGVLAALALFLGGCASGPGAASMASTASGSSGTEASAMAEQGPAPASEAVPAVLAPRPFTAEQIAEHMPVGTWHRYLMEPAGEPGFEELSTVLLCQGAGVTLESRAFELDGTARGDPQRMTANWTDLRDHATWPAAATVIRETQLALPSGTFECLRYTVTTEALGVPVVSRFYFAKGRPGPPVRYEEVRDGVRVFRMTLVGFGRAGDS